VSIFAELFLRSRQLLESEARSHAVLDNVADGIVTVSDDGLIESFNRAATDLFGYREQEAIGLEFSSLAGPKYPAEVPGHDEAGRHSFLEQHGYKRSTESFERRLDGSTFSIETRSKELANRRSDDPPCMPTGYLRSAGHTRRGFDTWCSTTI